MRASFLVSCAVTSVLVVATALAGCSSDGGDPASAAGGEEVPSPPRAGDPGAGGEPGTPPADLDHAPASTDDAGADASHCDACSVQPNGKTYRLPWSKGTSMQLTQDCDDSCCSDHVGGDEYAWDWANGGSFMVRAARGGTITHLKINSTKGCATTACSTDVNMIVIDHGDGTQAIYMHLAGNTAAAGITCGATVAQGQPLAMSGTTGHSTGVHLHFQVSQVHPGAKTCECGTDGKQCATTFNPYPNTWVNAPYHTLPIVFDEWPTASTCKNRRMTMPPALSQ